MEETEILPHKIITWKTLELSFKKPRTKVFFKNTKNSTAALHFENQEPCWILSLQEILWLPDDLPHIIQDHKPLINSSLPSENNFQEKTQGCRNFSDPSLSQKFSHEFFSLYCFWKMALYSSENLLYQLPTSVRPNTTLITRLSTFNENPWFSFNREFTLENLQIWFYVQQ